MHVESSTSGKNDDIARLYSPVFPASYSDDTCFKFKYYMKGIRNGKNLYDFFFLFFVVLHFEVFRVEIIIR